MSDEEYDLWWDEYMAAFPETAAALGRLDDQGEATSEIWKQAMVDVRYADAVQVTRKMLRGDLPAVGVYRLGETPAIVRRHAKDIEHAGRLSEAREVEQRATYERRYQQPAALGSLRALADQYRKLQDSGASYAEQQAWLDKVLPASEDDRRERFRCLLCRDSGFVPVWHEQFLIAFVQNKHQAFTSRKTALARCKCPRGSRRLGMALYDPLEHAVCHDEDDPKELVRLQAWIDQRQAARTRSMPNYTSEFDSWNEREGF